MNCVALTTKVSYPLIRDDRWPKVVRVAKTIAERHSPKSFMDDDVKPYDERKGRNDHHRAAIWHVQDALKQISDYTLAWSCYRHRVPGDWLRDYPRPTTTRKELIWGVERAVDYYNEWR